MNTETTTTIKAEPRTPTSKGANRKLRSGGSYIPGVLYSKGTATPIAVIINSLPKVHPRANVTTLEYSGSKKTVLMREVQVDPLTDKPLHFDFQEVASTDKVRVNIPLNFVGFTRDQEKEGSLGILVRYLEASGTLSDIPSSIEVNVGGLRAGNSIRLFDLELPKGLRIRTGKGKNVALASLVTASAE